MPDAKNLPASFPQDLLRGQVKMIEDKLLVVGLIMTVWSEYSRDRIRVLVRLLQTISRPHPQTAASNDVAWRGDRRNMFADLPRASSACLLHP